MDRILVGAEAAAYLKTHVVQEVVDTCRGVKRTIHSRPSTALELEVIIKLIDLQIAERLIVEGADISDFTAELYSSRVHVVRAIREVSK
jgi:hypothetical protein